MKKYIRAIVATVCCVIAVTACDKNKGDDGRIENLKLAGDWGLVTWEDDEVSGIFSVYMRLQENGRFELYQQLTTSWYEKLTGSYKDSDGTLSGRYSDGEPWVSSYDYELSADGKRLVLTSQSEGHERSVYERTSIPSDIVVKPYTKSEVESVRRVL